MLGFNYGFIRKLCLFVSRIHGLLGTQTYHTFAVYKARFTKKESVVRKELSQLSEYIDKHKNNIKRGFDEDSEGSVLHRHANHVQTLIDELDDLMTHMQKFSNPKKHKSTILRFKNKVCDIHSEHRRYINIYKDLLLKYDPLELKRKMSDDSKSSETINRINGLRGERNNIDSSLSMANDILAMGDDSEANLHMQGDTMKSTKKKQNKYIKLLPEINKILKGIKCANLRNNIIISLVLSILISGFIYFTFMKK
ncbi:unnamed protein product [Moneuplotes crassus]|uniref:Uncharacterized protein n=2 Tax=Euplotes crassus TaxID=5936 RepID=A0AAD2CX25_EUPCR|nr:unnamed protein product [Moneuplotes crassus]